jgi:hypothetical protein
MLYCLGFQFLLLDVYDAILFGLGFLLRRSRESASSFLAASIITERKGRERRDSKIIVPECDFEKSPKPVRRASIGGVFQSGHGKV